MKYRVLIGIENKKRRDEPGDTIKDGDYSKKTITHWVKTGVLKPLKKGKGNGDGKE